MRILQKYKIFNSNKKKDTFRYYCIRKLSKKILNIIIIIFSKNESSKTMILYNL